MAGISRLFRFLFVTPIQQLDPNYRMSLTGVPHTSENHALTWEEYLLNDEELRLQLKRKIVDELRRQFLPPSPIKREIVEEKRRKFHPRSSRVDYSNQVENKISYQVRQMNQDRLHDHIKTILQEGQNQQNDCQEFPHDDQDIISAMTEEELDPWMEYLSLREVKIYFVKKFRSQSSTKTGHDPVIAMDDEELDWQVMFFTTKWYHEKEPADPNFARKRRKLAK